MENGCRVGYVWWCGITDMNQKNGFIATLALAATFMPSAVMAQSVQSAPRETDSASSPDIAYPYRIFPTTNIWTQILLDTATGRVWQVQYSTSDDAPSGKWVINEASLLPQGETPKNGRFTLYPTQNMYTFLLLDRKDSRIWQLQWSVETNNRGIVRTITLEK